VITFVVICKQRRERNISLAKEKANEIKNFLSQFRKNDSLSSEFRLMQISRFSQIELEILNKVIDLNKTFKNGNNVIQSLLKEKQNHRQLVSFLLKAKGIQIPIQSVNDENETTFITIKKAFPKSRELPQFLFSRGYKMNQLDKKFIQTNYADLKQKELFYLYSSLEKLSNISQMEFFEKHLNKFLVIESAKQGKLTILGNENQSLVWMANLAAEQYSDYWFYFDKAFLHYGFYEKIFAQKKNGTFRKHFERLSTNKNQRSMEFEEVFGILYPEMC
jgi:Holliday junction resolvase